MPLYSSLFFPFIMKVQVEELIQDAKNQWLEMNDYDYDLDEETFPLPLIRLKVKKYSSQKFIERIWYVGCSNITIILGGI